MVSEQIALDIVASFVGRVATVTRTFNLDDAQPPTKQVSREKNALSDSDLVRPLLARYSLADIDAAIRWLSLGGYISRTEWVLGGIWVHVLTDKGLEVAKAKAFAPEERKLFYGQVEPYLVFIAHQFREEDASLRDYIHREVLVPQGYTAVDGRVEGLEEFRHAIVGNIQRARSFVCLLTHRSQLVQGGHVSSVWLYQEIGAAVALGKAPLLLVEEGMDSHYAGELQKTYEYIPFTRDNYREQFMDVVRRLNVDLEHHGIPLPSRSNSAA